MAFNSTRRLRALFQGILSLVPPAVAGCGGISTDGFEPITCKGEIPQYLPGLAIAPPADYLELRDIGFEGGDAQVRETRGTPCATATDAAACQAKIAAPSPTPGFQLGQCTDFCPEYALVVNRGDDVTFVTTTEEALALLGPIDAPADAVFRAVLGGYSVSCDSEESGVREVDGGYDVIATRLTGGCDPIETTQYRLSVATNGSIAELESSVISSESGCIGRRPAGLAARRSTGATRLGAFWGDIAHLEAASVHAFAALERELLHHGAPTRLVRRARRAKRDEVRHAAVTRRLAARHGGTAPKPRVARRPVRSLEEIAVENAAEGCVRETFGALIGNHQARAAADSSVREAMRAIAEDETRHAGLAWAVDAWLRTRLSAEAWQRVEAARREALEGLLASAANPTHPELVAGAGMPDARTATELARRFCAAIAA